MCVRDCEYVYVCLYTNVGGCMYMGVTECGFCEHTCVCESVHISVCVHGCVS